VLSAEDHTSPEINSLLTSSIRVVSGSKRAYNGVSDSSPDEPPRKRGRPRQEGALSAVAARPDASLHPSSASAHGAIPPPKEKRAAVRSGASQGTRSFQPAPLQLEDAYGNSSSSASASPGSPAGKQSQRKKPVPSRQASARSKSVQSPARSNVQTRSGAAEATPTPAPAKSPPRPLPTRTTDRSSTPTPDTRLTSSAPSPPRTRRASTSEAQSKSHRSAPPPALPFPKRARVGTRVTQARTGTTTAAVVPTASPSSPPRTRSARGSTLPVQLASDTTVTVRSIPFTAEEDAFILEENKACRKDGRRWDDRCEQIAPGMNRTWESVLSRFYALSIQAKTAERRNGGSKTGAPKVTSSRAGSSSAQGRPSTPHHREVDGRHLRSSGSQVDGVGAGSASQPRPFTSAHLRSKAGGKSPHPVAEATPGPVTRTRAASTGDTTSTPTGLPSAPLRIKSGQYTPEEDARILQTCEKCFSEGGNWSQMSKEVGKELCRLHTAVYYRGRKLRERQMETDAAVEDSDEEARESPQTVQRGGLRARTQHRVQQQRPQGVAASVQPAVRRSSRLSDPGDKPEEAHPGPAARRQEDASGERSFPPAHGASQHGAGDADRAGPASTPEPSARPMKPRATTAAAPTAAAKKGPFSAKEKQRIVSVFGSSRVAEWPQRCKALAAELGRDYQALMRKALELQQQHWMGQSEHQSGKVGAVSSSSASASVPQPVRDDASCLRAARSESSGSEVEATVMGGEGVVEQGDDDLDDDAWYREDASWRSASAGVRSTRTASTASPCAQTQREGIWRGSVDFNAMYPMLRTNAVAASGSAREEGMHGGASAGAPAPCVDT
jgi:hypothetical protein